MPPVPHNAHFHFWIRGSTLRNGISAMARGGANLLQQMAQAQRVAWLAAVACDGVDGGKFANSGGQRRSLHLRGKFQWRLRRPSRETAALQESQKLGI